MGFLSQTDYISRLLLLSYRQHYHIIYSSQIRSRPIRPLTIHRVNFLTEDAARTAFFTCFQICTSLTFENKIHYLTGDQYPSSRTPTSRPINRRGFSRDTDKSCDSLWPKKVWGYYEQTWKRVEKRRPCSVLCLNICSMDPTFTRDGFRNKFCINISAAALSVGGQALVVSGPLINKPRKDDILHLIGKWGVINRT